jgi:Ni/Fe-hydrogenase subunit HybB-like protein
MHDQKPILRSSAQAAHDQYANEPLSIVLGENGQTKPGLMIGAVVSLIVAVIALALWFLTANSSAANPGFWGISVASTLFWLSVVQGMIALGALIRLAHASWRFSLTRITDMTSLFGVGVAIVVLPMLGLMRAALYGPLGRTYTGQDFPATLKVWEYSQQDIGFNAFTVDILFVVAAFLAGIFMLGLMSRPDFAVLRDRAPESKKGWFRSLAGGWIGATRQWKVQRWAEGFFAVIIVITFFASQTSLGWDFQLAPGKDWDSSIYPFQFSILALQGGAAMLVLVMSIVRGRIQNKTMIGDKQYDAIGKMMIAFGLIFFYFRWCDYITAWFGHEPSEWPLQVARISGYPLAFVCTVLGCMAIPIFANIFGRVRKSPLLLSIVSICMLVGIWCQRFLDTTPAFNYRDMPIDATSMLGGLEAFVGVGALLLLTYFAAIPVYSAVSWWGLSRWRSRSSVRPFGNSTVTVMVEDPPVWEN